MYLPVAHGSVFIMSSYHSFVNFGFGSLIHEDIFKTLTVNKGKGVMLFLQRHTNFNDHDPSAEKRLPVAVFICASVFHGYLVEGFECQKAYP